MLEKRFNERILIHPSVRKRVATWKLCAPFRHHQPKEEEEVEQLALSSRGANSKKFDGPLHILYTHLDEMSAWQIACKRCQKSPRDDSIRRFYYPNKHDAAIFLYDRNNTAKNSGFISF